MTLIAVEKFAGVPVFISDLLVAGNSKIESVPPPTLDKINDIKFVGPQKIMGLARKIVILKNNLCFAWAGSRLGAMLVLDILNSELGDVASFDEVRNTLQNKCGEAASLGVGLMGAVIEDDQAGLFHWDSASNAFRVGDWFVDGSGASDFQHLVEGGRKIYEKKASENGYSSDTIEFILADMLGWAARLIGSEMTRGGGISK